MTIPEALIVAASSNRQMHAAGYTNYEVVREEALETLALELERVSKVAGEATGTDPEYRTSGCVDALVIHAKQLQDEVERLRAVPCACACHDVAGHADEPTMGMMLAEATKKIARLKEEVGRLQAELTRVTRPFFLHQSAYVQFGPVTPPSSQ